MDKHAFVLQCSTFRDEHNEVGGVEHHVPMHTFSRLPSRHSAPFLLETLLVMYRSERPVILRAHCSGLRAKKKKKKAAPVIFKSSYYRGTRERDLLPSPSTEFRNKLQTLLQNLRQLRTPRPRCKLLNIHLILSEL